MYLSINQSINLSIYLSIYLFVFIFSFINKQSCTQNLQVNVLYQIELEHETYILKVFFYFFICLYCTTNNFPSKC